MIFFPSLEDLRMKKKGLGSFKINLRINQKSQMVKITLVQINSIMSSKSGVRRMQIRTMQSGMVMIERSSTLGYLNI